MSFLQKLETLYAGLIRLLTVLLTLALLVVAGISLVNWQRMTAPEPTVEAKSASQTPPKVATEDVVNRVVASQTGTTPDPISVNDPNRPAYDRIKNTIEAFAKKHEVSKEDFDVEDLMHSVRFDVSYLDNDALKAAYATGLADTLDHALADPKIEALLAKKPAKPDDESYYVDEVTPMRVVQNLIAQYDTEFSQQSRQSDSDISDYMSHKNKQDAALRSLARTAGPLLLLLLVLQLLTFGRIEQNTRQLNGIGKDAR